MKILQVQSVIPNLFNCRTIEDLLPNLEFNREYNRTNHENHVNAPSHSRDVELEETGAGEIVQLRSKKFDLRQPRISLRGNQCEIAIESKLTQHALSRRFEKLRNRSAVPKPQRRSFGTDCRIGQFHRVSMMSEFEKVKSSAATIDVRLRG